MLCGLLYRTSLRSMLEHKNFISEVYIISIDRVLKNLERILAGLENNYGKVLKQALGKMQKLLLISQPGHPN